jgi:hypothetical protein
MANSDVVLKTKSSIQQAGNIQQTVSDHAGRIPKLHMKGSLSWGASRNVANTCRAEKSVQVAYLTVIDQLILIAFSNMPRLLQFPHSQHVALYKHVEAKE